MNTFGRGRNHLTGESDETILFEVCALSCA